MSDFVEPEPDMFDPAVQRAEEQRAYAEASASEGALSSYINRRREAYKAVFSEGDTTAADLEFVMLDLAAFCRAFEPTFHPTNTKVQDLLEGRREVYQRIMGFTRLSHDTLYVKYADAAAQNRNT